VAGSYTLEPARENGQRGNSRHGTETRDTGEHQAADQPTTKGGPEPVGRSGGQVERITRGQAMTRRDSSGMRWTLHRSRL
jgi:hypothetical protein